MQGAADEAADALTELVAPEGWRCVDLLSDLHLHADDNATAALLYRHLNQTDADALIILGDLFEVWVGDDALRGLGPEHHFLRDVCAKLRDATTRRPGYFMHGNRDFLLGSAFAQASGLRPLHDPCLLRLGASAWLLSHGDAWCLDDHEYLRFRQQVRSPAWQADFLARPLAEREAMARAMRQASEARKRDPNLSWADVDSACARQALQQHGCSTLIHGHTHRPADHDLGQGRTRHVLSDWDAQATPPRAEVLRLHASGRVQRLPVAP